MHYRHAGENSGVVLGCDTQGYPSLIEETFLADDRHHYTHAYAHFLESDHAFAMQVLKVVEFAVNFACQVSTQSVFDFSEGGYVGLTGRASQDGCADGEGSDDSKGAQERRGNSVMEYMLLSSAEFPH